MKALLLKDLLVRKKTWVLQGTLILILSIAGWLAFPLILFAGVMLPAAAMAADKACGWEKLAPMLPYSRKDRVLSRYLLGYMGMASAALLFLPGELLGDFLLHESFTDKSASFLMLGLALALLTIAVSVPAMLRYGSQIGRDVTVLGAVLTAILVVALEDQLSGWWINLLPPVLLVLSIPVTVGSMAVSMKTHTEEA